MKPQQPTFTPGELKAIGRALDYWLVSSSRAEALQAFGSPSLLRAAERAADKLDCRGACCAQYAKDGASHDGSCREALAG